MTITTATVAPFLGVLSADTMMYQHRGPQDHGDISDGTADSFHRAVWCGDGHPPICTPLSYAPKVRAVQSAKMAVAASGIPLSSGLASEIETSGFLDILDFDSAAPDMLRQLFSKAPIYALTIIWTVGWSDLAGRVMGFMYRSATNWQSEPFTGHRFGIIPHVDETGYDALLAAAEPAAHGIGTEQFHIDVARNVERAYRAGKAMKWLHFGGDLLVARVDRHGVHIRVGHTFQGAPPVSVLAPPANHGIGTPNFDFSTGRAIMSAFKL